MMPDLQSFAEELVSQTRDYIYIRSEDGLIILRPNRVHYLNATAKAMLSRLYTGDVPDVEATVREIAAEYEVDEARVREDLYQLLVGIAALLRDDVCGAPAVRSTTFGSHRRDLPVLSEVALTYRCQNHCVFCYADSPARGSTVSEMTTDQVKLVIDRIFDEAHCPTVSFTGGEPTLRADLPELVRYAKAKGMRVNLITNGLRCSQPAYVAALAEAGLDSAQVSLEGGSAEIHDAVVRHPGAFEKTTRAVKELRAAGIHTHTNTTICGGNRNHLLELVDYIAEELRSEYFSMNMVIQTGTALGHPEEEISYREIGPIIEMVQTHARKKGVRFVWYSPLPYCIFNPIAHGLGSKSCAAVDGLLSVSPSGEVLPCSSFERGIGSLLRNSFAEVWFSPTALYWRRKEFLPPVCQNCELKTICCGACPLYWDQRGNFDELANVATPAPTWRSLLWQVKRRWWGRTQGVGLSTQRK
ncbi:MAG: radical SAM protein [Chloroflexi bacterium]|nr:radical SAM protein [Chloroflexota bacterium]